MSHDMTNLHDAWHVSEVYHTREAYCLDNISSAKWIHEHTHLAVV